MEEIRFLMEKLRATMREKKVKQVSIDLGTKNKKEDKIIIIEDGL